MTASYSLRIKRSAEKELRAVPKTDLQKIIRRIQGLMTDARPPGHQKLSELSVYRVRQGNYRILYTVDDAERKVDIIKVGHRRGIYRSLRRKI